jgi:hypothetical protein
MLVGSAIDVPFKKLVREGSFIHIQWSCYFAHLPDCYFGKKTKRMANQRLVLPDSDCFVLQ